MKLSNLFGKKSKTALDPNAWHFSTSIMCNGCIAKITPVLDSAEGISSWQVALDTPERVLSVVPDGITKEQLIALVKGAGFNIEEL